MVDVRAAERRSRGSWRLAIAWTLVALIGLVWAMARLHLDSTPTVEAAADNLRQLWPYWITSAAVWIGLTAMWMVLRREPRDAARDEGRFWLPALMVLLVALGVRVAVLSSHEASLSNDVYRYVFDGRNLVAGYNPYLALPADRLHAPAERWPGERQLVPRLAFPELATPYLPVSEAVFGAIGLTIGTRWVTPSSSARAFRVGFVLIELAMLLTMLLVLKRAGRSAWWAALYAWHPLPVAELAGSGHQEVIGVAFLVGSLAVFTTVPGRTSPWTALLALSALGKPVALLAGAIMLRRRPLRVWLACAVFGAVVIVASIAPLWLIWGDHGRAYQNWRATVDQLGQGSAHFGGVYEAVRAVARQATRPDGRVLGLDLPPELLARTICLVIFAAAAIGILLSRLNVWQATCAMQFAVVLLAPVAFPWYLLWAFALFPMADSRALWTLSLTLPWGNAAWADAMHRKVPPWLLVVTYAPVLIAVAWDVARHSRRLDSEAR